MYMMSFFYIPKGGDGNKKKNTALQSGIYYLNPRNKGVLKTLEYLRSRFFWHNDEHKKKYRLLKWTVLFQPKKLCGIGIQNLDIQNKCFLEPSDQEGRGLPLLDGAKGVKDQFLDLGSFKLNSSTQIRFWEDVWLGNQPFIYLYPNLFNILRKKYVIVAKVFSTNPLNVYFRRALFGDKLLEWHTLVARLVHINLTRILIALYGDYTNMAYSLLSLCILTLSIMRGEIGAISLVLSVARLKPFIPFL
ncbi:hypothetical protein U9M48_005531 [Paspalum notatum var. saurae]|uniref:Uncharacterized protein n=1 Tax=Paspalum notatum var. saurae TaxID=547442 RepID=A0AAQ3SK28_PASNO